MINAVLACFDLLAPLIRRLGVDYAQFRAILETKLMLDARRRSGLQVNQAASSSRSSRKPRNTFAASLIFYACMGLTLVGLVMAAPPLFSMTVVHLYIMTMVALSLVADFSSVLLDTTDNAILQPRPVPGRTVLAARVAHIATYLGLLALSMSAVVLIVGTLSIHPLFAPVFLATLCCSITLVLSAANVVYLAAMRLTTPERLRDAITYCQIGLAAVVVGGSQVVPRLIESGSIRDLHIEDSGWIYFFPPTWMAGPIDLLAGQGGGAALMLTVLAVAVPAAGFLLVLFVVAPQFNRMLAAAEASALANDQPPAAGGPRRPTTTLWFAAPLTRTPAEAAVLELVWRICARDRQFKMRTYPSLVFPILFSFGFMMSGPGTLPQKLVSLPQTDKHFLLLYMAAAMISNVLLQLRFSDRYEAAWVYQVLPIPAAGDVLMGAMKAMLLRYIMPGFALVSVPVLAIWGWRSLPDVAVAFCATLFISAMEAALLARSLPFSTAFGAMEMSGRVARSMLLMLVPAAIGFAHFGLGFIPGALVPFGLLLLLGAWLFARGYRRTTWADLRAEEV